MSAAEHIADNVFRIATGLSNAYLVGEPGSWVLIDCGSEGYADEIRAAAESRFGKGARPEAILLTHGHFDHSGSAGTLARSWNVSIFAHQLEIPYLTGQSKYPPPDPTVGGFMSFMIRFFPNKAYDYNGLVKPLTANISSALERWQIVETPGHSPGHVSFFRSSDSLLIAGDAFTTVNQDSALDMLRRKREVCRPPVYYTCDWESAHESVQKLAALNPRTLAAGHGEPMSGSEATRQLHELALHFPIPEDGRYVRQKPVTNETGVVKLPPPVPDLVPRIAAGVGIAAAAAIAVGLANRSR